MSSLGDIRRAGLSFDIGTAVMAYCSYMYRYAGSSSSVSLPVEFLTLRIGGWPSRDAAAAAGASFFLKDSSDEPESSAK